MECRKKRGRQRDGAEIGVGLRALSALAPPPRIRYAPPMAAAPKTRPVHLELPSEIFELRRWDPQELEDELRLLLLIELVRDRRLAYGRAAELAGVPIGHFVRIMGRHGVSPFDYDPGELAEELAS